MKLTAEKIFKPALLLSCLSCVAGEPIKRCPYLASQIERYDPSDPGTVIECVKCPDCPEGQGLSPQCGDRVTNDTKIECKPCIANITYSDSHGIGSCKSCPECGLKNIIQHCTPRQKRVCGTVCPPGYFLDHNRICQECYFCCDNVSESGRRHKCKKIGMDRNWQCEKTDENQRCKEALDKATTTPTVGTPTTPRLSDKNNYTMTTMNMTEKHLNTEADEGSENSLVSGSTTMGSIPQTAKKETFPPIKESSSEDPSKEGNGKGQEKDDGSFRTSVGAGTIIVFLPVVALLIYTKREKIKSFRLSRQKGKAKDSIELLPLRLNRESPTGSGRTTPQDLPDPKNIPAGCRVSEIAKLRDNKGTLMLFKVQNKLDVLRTSTRKNWYDVGLALGVSSDELDLIEPDYIARVSPTNSLLSKLETRENEPTMREVVQALIICERQDVANIICNWPWEKYFMPLASESPPERDLQATVDNVTEVG